MNYSQRRRCRIFACSPTKQTEKAAEIPERASLVRSGSTAARQLEVENNERHY
jgi:hypothetical protein